MSIKVKKLDPDKDPHKSEKLLFADLQEIDADPQPYFFDVGSLSGSAASSVFGSRSSIVG
jgi:hypothetical protein